MNELPVPEEVDMNRSLDIRKRVPQKPSLHSKYLVRTCPSKQRLQSFFSKSSISELKEKEESITIEVFDFKNNRLKNIG